jgi:TPR repeat protein
VNWERAVDHWKAAASAGSVVADWELGDYFGDPDLGAQDLAQAEYHYLRSARSGSFIGLHKLGSFYRDRAGKPREALKWWSHAIRKGLFNMAYEIGRLYHDRLLPAEDAEATALAWYIVAVEHDTDHAKPKVAAMRNRLGSDRVREAARQAAAIRAEFGLQSPPRTAP